MSGKEEVRQFLMSRRAGLTPAEVGIPVVDDDRRVPGLRREEVAMLAGVSVDHYTRVENEELTALIGELSTLSPYFRDDWARRDVHEHRTGVKHFRHPRVGALELAFRVLETPGDSAHRLVTYSAEPGSETAERLAILAGVAAESGEHPARKENP